MADSYIHLGFLNWFLLFDQARVNYVKLTFLQSGEIFNEIQTFCFCFVLHYCITVNLTYWTKKKVIRLGLINNESCILG